MQKRCIKSEIHMVQYENKITKNMVPCQTNFMLKKNAPRAKGQNKNG